MRRILTPEVIGGGIDCPLPGSLSAVRRKIRRLVSDDAFGEPLRLRASPGNPREVREESRFLPKGNTHCRMLAEPVGDAGCSGLRSTDKNEEARLAHHG